MIADDELMEMLRDLEAAGQNQAVDYMPEWNKANKQALDLRTQISAAFAEMRAERDAALERERVLREAVDNLIDYRDRVSALGFQLEKADDYIDALRRITRTGKEVQPTNEAAPGAVINTDIEEG